MKQTNRLRLVLLIIILTFSAKAETIPAIGNNNDEPKVETTNENKEPTDMAERESEADNGYKFRVGGYGEMVANWKDYGLNRWNGSVQGNTREHRATVSIPRFVIEMNYRLTPRWELCAEIEFESGGTGSAVELEKSENLEYEVETEKGGEVALEQFHITRFIVPEFNVRVGHMVVPVGLTNAHHEPLFFFGTSRPEGETTILPSTWHATGLEFFGNFGHGLTSFSYQAMVVAGMNADGFSRDNWVKGGRDGLFEEDQFTSPAFVGRLNWHGVDGLRLGLSAYYCHDVTKNSTKPYKYSSVGQSSLSILSADGQYVGRYFTARGTFIWGNLQNSAAISDVTNLGIGSPYPGSRFRSIAKTGVTYGAEIGLHLKDIVGRKFPNVIPFARYEYINPQEKGSGKQTMDTRDQVSKWTVGLNWRPLPNLVVKADYATRQIGTKKIFGTSTMTSENEFAIGVAYMGWFFRK